MAGLVWVDSDVIQECESEYQHALSSETPDQKLLENVKFQLAWALAHSRNKRDVKRAITLLQGEELEPYASPNRQRDHYFTLAVAYLRDGDNIKAKDMVDKALEVSPKCSQCQSLRTEIVEATAKDALIGVGLLAAGVGIVGSLLLAGSKRR
mmetsp:Transcript_21599/g.26016  ORF Transcript_21599/g.26016 Transcript_21599/m.26016 type:complete len:152 (-) Transcript_21599:360-815(-)|eukprot:CAMPEP_0197849916 /NCGR_PEP_ID=MMETSP1438-20131217/13644_1 /TAXON_ID=1461541 /ORGANISM="Pterosperma sp., Strain CCMP1384" /LENGTH=151 /DNA_ID=CAMNT_0043462821 /DNA_START=325 /DNA_END=780 /DNA_ORIENTATION=-